MPDEEISAIELADMRARVNVTTPGPCIAYFEGRDHYGGSSFIQTATQDIEISAEDYRGGGGHYCADLDFIAHAKQDIPRLLDEVERLRSLLRGADS